MKTIILLGLTLFCCINIHSQEIITEANYLKQDSILWTDFGIKQEQLFHCWEIMPDKQDSIKSEYDKLLKIANDKNIELAIKYASVPSGLQRLYMVRLDISKDSLENILNSLSTDIQNSAYGKNIREHLQTTQIEEEDSIFTFDCVTDDGQKFDWNELADKQVLLLYGGLSCMGNDGRQYLKQLYETTSRNNFLIVVYWPCSSLQDLQETKKQYPSDYIFISDFKQDASPMKIKYGTQATPTCFLTDKQHHIKVKCTGIHPELFNSYIQFTNN
ncbi:hypothetical protein [Parabacteroides bouchesdurhonensis]|uniref:hypothetical protein n=1 Tax=Parabacteroides bouchesdurhonensis TaxID=1936995 RepID=UPI000E48295D|nr:hypothetical protein [Parabacteroides bouchesdurhonensis]RHJ91355.1 hypothetical protein DW095_10220 [Bacteroides sp. AM07-16]